jgi:polar amino acid transport system ATP-binding protein
MIELNDVHKSFGANEVLRGITAEIGRGEVVCIIGPSGSGKSTVLRCINGLEGYDAGSIRVGGTHVDRHSPAIKHVRTQLAMVFQRFNLFPHRTALENVIEGPIYVKGARRDEVIPRARELLSRVGLAGRCSGSRSRARSPCSPRRSCSTSRHRRWIRNWSARCSRSCGCWRKKA